MAVRRLEFDSFDDNPHHEVFYFLCRDSESGKVYVQYDRYDPRGNCHSDHIEKAEFLSRKNDNVSAAKLLALIGTLVPDANKARKFWTLRRPALNTNPEMESAMEYGICMFLTDYSMQAADLAVAVEERGFDALFVPDHTYIPVTRASQFRLGGDLPPDYSHNLDMFVALSAAAAVTKRIRLGTGVCLIIERDPIITAKEVASLDHISGGRVDFGIGGGWNREEMENHGAPWKRRWKVARERIQAMQAIWTQDEARYAGEFVNFDAIWSWPKPVQKPHPPIFIGGDAAGTFKRILRYGDGWIPMLAEKGAAFDAKIQRMAELAALARKAGRLPFPVTTFGTPRDPDAIAGLAKAGVTRCIFGLNAARKDAVLPRLDKLADLIARANERICA